MKLVIVGVDLLAFGIPHKEVNVFRAAYMRHLSRCDDIFILGMDRKRNNIIIVFVKNFLTVLFIEDHSQACLNENNFVIFDIFGALSDAVPATVPINVLYL